MSQRSPADLLPLTDLAFHILVVLTDADQHGYALIKEIRRRTGRDTLRTGTLYAALSRLQDDGLVEETDPPEAQDDEDGRRRYYRTTQLGSAAASAEAVRLAELLALAREKRLIPTEA